MGKGPMRARSRGNPLKKTRRGEELCTSEIKTVSSVGKPLSQKFDIKSCPGNGGGGGRLSKGHDEIKKKKERAE